MLVLQFYLACITKYENVGTVGVNRSQAEMIKSLANLIKDEKSFEKSFRDSVILDHDHKKTHSRSRPHNRINDLIEQSRVFFVG